MKNKKKLIADNLEIINTDILNINQLPFLPKVEFIPANLLKQDDDWVLGGYLPNNRTIYLDSSLSEEEIEEIFLHEFGHFLHHVLFDNSNVGLVTEYNETDQEELFANAFYDLVMGHNSKNVRRLKTIISSKVETYF
ncbi:ImmA/IrrE family metallo-endopeptidase [Brevibacillus gelatini]|uniref:ImmA/IrrE family metallo-endopeptidase n=1 Tax=Brevibacillus gelatini TaxID=1655277 RepID=A0A3M8B9J2_9BACL|nr:ImmA/IrrE family metallo-endopeptidase [Brevibacillus gelatini]RNB59495.1 ImmA/IrrE family metallo-endopeptidase [Brevibacillus gelatini]